MNKVDRYLQAATRDNTRRSYQSAVRHFEEEWGGFLPATSENLARYLADYAETLAASTLKQRLAALAQWHVEQGFPDPTKTALVRKVLKGIRELHPAVEKQAKPFQIEQLRQLDLWLTQRIQCARETGDQEALTRHSRNRALILLGFWRGMRSDELCRLQIEHIHLYPSEGMTLFLPRSKGDRQSEGRTFKAPALQQLCPVEACHQWLSLSGLTEGPLLRRIDRWGVLGANSLHPNSIVPLLRSLFTEAHLADPNTYSSHSLRRGFASWANGNGWDMKSLMSYVGWKDIKSAMRYLDAPTSFNFEPQVRGLPVVVNQAEPVEILPQWTDVHVDLHLVIERYHGSVKTINKARDHIERISLKTHKMRCRSRERGHYRLTIYHESADHLDRILSDLLSEMQQIADSHQCFVEAYFVCDAIGKRWD